MEIVRSRTLKILGLIAPENKKGCWEWLGSLNKAGYGKIKIFYKMYLAHRVVWFITKGSIDESMVLDHQCKNRKCVNPKHLRQVTQTVNAKENTSSPLYLNSLKTHCPKGHEYSEENIVMEKTSRRCRICKKERQRLRWLKKKKNLV